MSEASVKITDLQRELGETASLKNRLQQQHVELVHRADEAVSQLDQANKAKTMLTRQLEEVKQAVDDETSVRNKVMDKLVLKNICVDSIKCIIKNIINYNNRHNNIQTTEKVSDLLRNINEATRNIILMPL